MPFDDLCHPDVGLNPDLQAAEAWLNAQVARVRATGQFAEFVTITPAMARVLLMHNPANRHLVANTIRRFVREMQAGVWHENGEPIIVADTGELNDGQHRLTAIADAGVAIKALMAFGVSRDSRKTVDTGNKRTAGHILGMAGVKDSNVVASALKILLNLQAGASLTTHREAIEIEAALKAHPALMDDHGIPKAAARTFRVSQGLFVALHYLMAQHSKAKAAAFFDTLNTGLGLVDPSSPVQRLRKRLEANLGAKAKLPIGEVAAVTIKAWNAYVEGRALEYLRWRTVGDKPEDFPQVRG